MHRRRAVRRGFTLLEILLVTLLLGLLSALVYGLLIQGIRRSRELADQTARQHQGQVLQSLLQSDLVESGAEGCFLGDSYAAMVPLAPVDSSGAVHWSNRLLLYVYVAPNLHRYDLSSASGLDLSALELGRTQAPKLTEATVSPLVTAVSGRPSSSHWSDLGEWKLVFLAGGTGYHLRAVFHYGRQEDVIDTVLW